MSLPSLPKVYETSRSGRVLLIVLALGGLAVVINFIATAIKGFTSGASNFTDNLFAFFFVVIMGFGVYALADRSTLKLIVSERGIEYHELGVRFFIPWENLDFIEVGRASGRAGGPYVMLRLKQPAQRLSAWGWPGSDKLTRLDVSPFLNPLLNGDLAETIRHYASNVHIPHQI